MSTNCMYLPSGILVLVNTTKYITLYLVLKLYLPK